ncbi:hypothetical protein RFI_12630 [Reticulomyxa filosa]|uniref:Transmembrane protein n=1 Tax=Reticulomyxa filosa TaxID=46433 RepID=X6NGP0_RETFI|nr:hypothetical protein RFI_12630 [Reticulomyxa filosa]|eukprot:ETO24527.1 hypothetical protein RFI_12630 [Reticulomyxa filosa]
MEKREEQPQKLLGCVSIVQLVILSCTLIMMKEFVSSVNWIYWLAQEHSDRGDKVEILVTDLLFAFSLFFMQLTFVERMRVSLADTSYQYSALVYALVRANIILILFVALCVSYLEAFGPLWMLWPCFTGLCTLVVINSVAVTVLLHRGLFQIVSNASTGIQGTNDNLMNVLVRLTFVSALALGLLRVSPTFFVLSFVYVFLYIY